MSHCGGKCVNAAGDVFPTSSRSGPSSVMELLRPEDRQRLLSLRNSSNPPSAKTSIPVSSHASQTSGKSAQVLPASSDLQQISLAAWRGNHTSSQTFKPFEKNPSKQARYELYLSCLKQGDNGKRLRPAGPIMHCRIFY